MSIDTYIPSHKGRTGTLGIIKWKSVSCQNCFYNPKNSQDYSKIVHIWPSMDKKKDTFVVNLVLRVQNGYSMYTST